MTAPRILILGGTADARALAERLVEKGNVEVITSLAGRTTNPPPVAGRMRTGGFGGAKGLADYLRGETIAAVIDATHPFAARISANAKAACDKTKTPRLYLTRAPWRMPDHADVTACPDFEAAAKVVGKHAKRVLLTTGTQGIEAFADCADVHFIVRLIEDPTNPLPLAHHEILRARPPFDEAGEAALMTDHAIDTLVTKDSGGAATAAKITAAAKMDIPIILIARPPAPAGETAETVEAALAWIERWL